MYFYSCWFLAEPEEADTILGLASEKNPPLDNWSHLILKGVDGQDVNKLERLVLPKQKGRPKPGGKILSKSKMTADPFICVCLVEPTFVEGLADLDDAAAGEIGERWFAALEDVEEGGLVKLVKKMAAFSREVDRGRKPVLQLDIY